MVAILSVFQCWRPLVRVELNLITFKTSGFGPGCLICFEIEKKTIHSLNAFTIISGQSIRMYLLCQLTHHRLFKIVYCGSKANRASDVCRCGTHQIRDCHRFTRAWLNWDERIFSTNQELIKSVCIITWNRIAHCRLAN